MSDTDLTQNTLSHWVIDLTVECKSIIQQQLTVILFPETRRRRRHHAMELKCSVQSYDWGKRGSESAVATLMKSSDKDFVLDESKPYAELWMGTHPNGPSFVKDTTEPLRNYIKTNTRVLGETVEETFGDDLPFLLKVLSVHKALSIQAHPDRVRMIFRSFFIMFFYIT